jgi:catechol 2,3-dioxygenase-like lactoylglutathione lyase family enzyme
MLPLEVTHMKIKFVAGFGPLVRDRQVSLEFYRDTLGLPLHGDEYVSADEIDGVKHFGQWTLEAAAQSIFGTRQWPSDVPTPQANIEFDVESEEAVGRAAQELRNAGHRILVGPKKEEWGQTVLRLSSPEGLLISITYTPWMQS